MPRMQTFEIVPRTVLTLIGLGLVLVAGTIGCSRNTKPIDEDNTTMKPIEEVLDAHKDSLMALDGVEGVGQGECDGTPCIRVFVSEKTSAVKELPESLDGYAVDVEVTGTFGPRSPQ